MEAANPPIRFDSTRKGKKVLLTNGGTCAERTEPLKDDGEYAGVISDVPLVEDKLFQMMIERTIWNKWRDYGISIGVICDKEEAEVEGAKGIFYNQKGIWAIKSLITDKGKSDLWKNSDLITRGGYNLDTRRLKVGTTFGIKLCSNGDLCFFLNGEDKGVAFQNVPKSVYAFVDIIKYVTKIRIME